MSKSKLKKSINASRKKILNLEQKRNRSQSALVYALLNGTAPNSADVETFNHYTELIDNERAQMNSLMAELEN